VSRPAQADSSRRRLLVVEDDPDLARLARLHLEDEGYAVRVEHDGARALDAARREAFDLVVLDLMLPGLDGLEVCRALRNEPRYVPIIVVTAKGSEIDRVLGLELGADDYLAKPVSYRELVARVRSIFRRIDAMVIAGSERDDRRPLVSAGLEIDPVRRTVRLSGKRVELTAKEFDLLFHFASHPGRVFTRADLVDAVWGAGYVGYEHTVNSHINRLRGKISGEGSREKHIETVWGVGYRFVEPERVP
jgi:DNA-binding response OmpR family regulator